MKSTPENWEQWFERWNGSELARLVVRLAEILLARGECTVDDVRNVQLKEQTDPRIRGAAVRAMVRLGLATMEALPVRSVSSTCHHRPIQRFVLLDSNACRALTERVADAVLRRGVESRRFEVVENGQLLMGV
ncbi:MAG: hypothetical protein WC530_09445 [Candidatus Omnitrophota bacterium]|jgi:hypothetical protein